TVFFESFRRIRRDPQNFNVPGPIASADARFPSFVKAQELAEECGTSSDNLAGGVREPPGHPPVLDVLNFAAWEVTGIRRAGDERQNGIFPSAARHRLGRLPQLTFDVANLDIAGDRLDRRSFRTAREPVHAGDRYRRRPV